MLKAENIFLLSHILSALSRLTYCLCFFSSLFPSILNLNCAEGFFFFSFFNMTIVNKAPLKLKECRKLLSHRRVKWYCCQRGFPGGSVVKNPPVNVEDAC